MGLTDSKKVDILSSGVLLTPEDILKACDYAKRKGVRAIIVPQRMVRYARENVNNTDVRIGTRINYPKADLTFEAVESIIQQSILDGASEIELTLPPLLIKYGKVEAAKRVLRKLVNQYKPLGVTFRVHVVRELRNNVDLVALADALMDVEGLDGVVLYNGESPAPIGDMNPFKEREIPIKLVQTFINKKMAKEANQYGASKIGTEKPEELLGS